MIEGLARVKAMLQAPRDNAEGPALHPADRAAEIILSLRPTLTGKSFIAESRSAGLPWRRFSHQT